MQEKKALICNPMDCSLPGSSVHGILQADPIDSSPLGSPVLGILQAKIFFCLFYFFLPPFEDLGCFSGWLMSSAGLQKLFCGIYSAFKCSFDAFVGDVGELLG